MRNEDSPPPPESASSESPDRPWYVRRSTLAVTVAALAPACLAGWVLTEVLGGSGTDDSRPPRIVMPLAASKAAGAPAAGAAPR
ncbi:N-acetylmuramoyl-L-alanine amidase, partial [Streptomyces sp. ISL-66]|nr:N-acetylmuramoyl-L-alanine amidase [Streptomyces sp. ISL-66]